MQKKLKAIFKYFLDHPKLIWVILIVFFGVPNISVNTLRNFWHPILHYVINISQMPKTIKVYHIILFSFIPFIIYLIVHYVFNKIKYHKRSISLEKVKTKKLLSKKFTPFLVKYNDMFWEVIKNDKSEIMVNKLPFCITHKIQFNERYNSDGTSASSKIYTELICQACINKSYNFKHIMKDYQYVNKYIISKSKGYF